MVMAFKKSGVFGDYDVVDDLDLIRYANSVPAKHEPVEDYDYFKKYQAQYFTPSNLKNGLSRSADNIADVQGILFDLDEVDDLKALRHKFYLMMIKSKVEAYLWATPSSLFGGSHKNAQRLYIPLAEAINPNLLPVAVDELVSVLNKIGINVSEYGADLTSSKTVGRLMGLPIQQVGTIVPWNISKRFRYRVKAKYVPEPQVATSEFQPMLDLDAMHHDDTLVGFVENYIKKHALTWNKGERDDNLMKVIGAIAVAWPAVKDQEVYETLDVVGVTSYLDHPSKDILKKTRKLLK
jgi:hypothetical protein